MNNLTILLSILSVPILSAGPIQHSVENGLELRVVTTTAILGYPINSDQTGDKTIYYRVEYQPILMNRSDTTLRVPTDTENGGPLGPSWSRSDNLNGYSFYYFVEDEPDEEHFWVSEYRFFPVDLKPGQSTKLPEISVTTSDPENLPRVYISFEVEKAFSEHYKFWSGSLLTFASPAAGTLQTPNK